MSDFAAFLKDGIPYRGSFAHLAPVAVSGRSTSSLRRFGNVEEAGALRGGRRMTQAILNDTQSVLQFVLEKRRSGDWDAVERLCRAELARNPADTELSWQLAGALWRRHDPVAAEAVMRAAHYAHPKNGDVLAAVALFVAEQARYGAARRLYERAFALKYSSASSAVDLAELELRGGAWARGWARYEARLTRTDRGLNSAVTIMSRIAPYWTGQSLKGQTLLVYSEQGNGDDIQMMRFIPTLADYANNQGGHLVLACRRSLFPLVARHYSPCIELEAGRASNYAQYGTPTYCLPMMSVPYALRLKPEQVRGTSYLRPDIDRAIAWRSRVHEATPSPTALQVGITWRGDPNHRRDAQRSMPMSELTPLFALEDVVFHPLTPGIEALPENVPRCNLTAHYKDGFDDVAAHVSALDAIVTIDSAPLHLGGALGVPVLAMLDHVSQWSWGTQEAQRWYDSVRLYRQPQPGVWRPVIERVAATLSSLIAVRQMEMQGSAQ